MENCNFKIFHYLNQITQGKTTIRPYELTARIMVAFDLPKEKATEIFNSWYNAKLRTIMNEMRVRHE